MGVLIQIALLGNSAFDALWESWQLGSRPKGLAEMRTAMKIEDKLLAVSEEKKADEGPEIGCPKCKERYPQTQLDRFSYWRVPTRRAVREGGEAIFLEDTDWRYLKAALTDIQPPQPLVRNFVAMWDVLEAAEKDWKGDEPDLRRRLGEGQLALPKVEVK